MPVTLTIKQVPESLAEALKKRAASHRRSLQQELLLIIELAVDGFADPVFQPGVRLAEPTSPRYQPPAGPDAKPSRPDLVPTEASEPRSGKLSLDALWQRARKLGAPMPSESAAIVRRDRDARHRR